MTTTTAEAKATEAGSMLASFRHRGISATVFENHKDGKTWLSTSVQKRYKDEKSGEFRTSTYFRRDELPVLKHVVDQAYAFALEHENARGRDDE